MEGLERCNIIPNYTVQLNQRMSPIRPLHYRNTWAKTQQTPLRYIFPYCVYSTSRLHIIVGNTSCGTTSVSNSIVKVHKQCHITHGNCICSDTVFSEATVMELIDREKDKVWGAVYCHRHIWTVLHACMYVYTQGTFAAILTGDVPSCYLSEYKQRRGNAFNWAFLWDKFPLSKKLVSFALSNDCYTVVMNGSLQRACVVGNSGRVSMEADYSTWRERLRSIQQGTIHPLPWGMYNTRQDWTKKLYKNVWCNCILLYRLWSTSSWRTSMWRKRLHKHCTAQADRLHDSSTVQQRYPI